MKRFERAFISAIAVALLAGATPATAQDVVLTRGDDGDLRATWDGEEPTEFVLVTATVDREGNVLDRTRGKTIVLKPGEDIGVGRSGLPGFGSFEIRDPKPYTPGRDGLPGKKYWTNPAGDVNTPRRDDVAAGPSGTGKTMDEPEGEKADNDERAMPRVKTNTVRKPAGRTKAADTGIGDRGGDVFHIVTLVPADESARRIHVQPVILHDPAPSDEPDR